MPKPFIHVRKREVEPGSGRWAWVWICTKCPCNPRNKMPCGGRHLVRRFLRGHEPDARVRATNAALTHYVLKHSAREG